MRDFETKEGFLNFFKNNISEVKKKRNIKIKVRFH